MARPPKPGAPPWQVGGLARRQRARPSLPEPALPRAFDQAEAAGLAAAPAEALAEPVEAAAEPAPAAAEAAAEDTHAAAPSGADADSLAASSPAELTALLLEARLSVRAVGPFLQRLIGEVRN